MFVQLLKWNSKSLSVYLVVEPDHISKWGLPHNVYLLERVLNNEQDCVFCQDTQKQKQKQKHSGFFFFFSLSFQKLRISPRGKLRLLWAQCHHWEQGQQDTTQFMPMPWTSAHTMLHMCRVGVHREVGSACFSKRNLVARNCFYGSLFKCQFLHGNFRTSPSNWNFSLPPAASYSPVPSIPFFPLALKTFNSMLYFTCLWPVPIPMSCKIFAHWITLRIWNSFFFFFDIV